MQHKDTTCEPFLVLDTSSKCAVDIIW